MNIFAVNSCPYESAKQLPLKLIVKMPTETIQLLCGLVSQERLTRHDVPRKADGTPYKHFNPKHPCAIWVRESYGNFMWAMKHAAMLCIEYERLYKRSHCANILLSWFMSRGGAELHYGFDNREMTPFAQAMPEKYKNVDPHVAYQNYIVGEKQHYARWSDLDHIPDWWVEKTDKWVDKSFVNGVYTKR